MSAVSSGTGAKSLLTVGLDHIPWPQFLKYHGVLPKSIVCALCRELPVIQCTDCLPSEIVPPAEDLRVSVAPPGPSALWDTNGFLFPWPESFDDIIKAFMVGSQDDSTPADHEAPSRMTPGNERRPILAAERPPLIGAGGVPPVTPFESDAAAGPGDNPSVDVTQTAEPPQAGRLLSSFEVAYPITGSRPEQPLSLSDDLPADDRAALPPHLDTTSSSFLSTFVLPVSDFARFTSPNLRQPPPVAAQPRPQKPHAPLPLDLAGESRLILGTQPTVSVCHPSVRLDGRIGESGTPNPAPQQPTVTPAGARGFNSSEFLSKNVHSHSPVTLRVGEVRSDPAGPKTVIGAALPAAPPADIGSGGPARAGIPIVPFSRRFFPCGEIPPGGPARARIPVVPPRQRTPLPKSQAPPSSARVRKPLGNGHNLQCRSDIRETLDQSPRPLVVSHAQSQIHSSGIPPDAAAPPALPPALLARHIVQRLTDEPHPGVTDIQIQLDPPTLGRVDIRLTLDAQNGVRAALRTELPTALQAIHAVVPDIRSALESHGFHVTRLDVGSGMLLDAGGHHDGGGMMQHHDQPPFSTSESGPPVIAAAEVPRAAARARQRLLPSVLRLVNAVA